jgi:hypothetical protein
VVLLQRLCVVLRATIVNSTEGANSALFLEFLGRRYPTARKKSKIKGGRVLPVLFTLDFALTGTTKEIGFDRIELKMKTIFP